jgi:uncharacterized membrane protein YgcG
MTEQQLWALIAFVVLVVVLAGGLSSSRPKLNGRQKYRARNAPLLDESNGRPSVSPIAAALAAIFVGSSRDNGGGSDATDGGDSGGGDSGGGGGE